ncbi:MAG: exodeoxyribonuclease V subunit alpha [Planctomycetes bacterium]|nr:exodeoxyribonuclease V subunit alpha [Planctomycetota bacterium]
MSEVDIATLRPAASSTWFARRLARNLSSEDTALEQPLTWLHHQWLQGHTCLDLAGTVLGDVESTRPGTERMQARARVPASWRTELASLACVERSDPGGRSASERLLVLEGDKLFLAACRHDEIVVAEALLHRAAQASRWTAPAGGDAWIAERVRALLPQADALQIAAAGLPFRSRLGIVTGGPGTGKTTVAGCMLDALLQIDEGAVVRVLAPTGKAAARMTQSLRSMSSRAGLHARTSALLQSVEASTIQHALLAGGGAGLRAAGLVIVDESSMIDISLMRRLLEGLAPEASLVLLGDPAQLASVEAGTMLSDVLPASPSHPLHACTVALTHSHRFAKDSALGALAAAIRDADMDGTMRALQAGGDIQWISVGSSAEAIDAVVRTQARFFENARVLCGHRRGPDGSLAMNRAITRARFAAVDPDPLSGGDFIGRPVIVTVNDPVTGLHNGDTGIVESGPEGLIVRFPDLGQVVPVRALPARETAWALTIHKSQGSEFDEVVIVLPVQASPVLTRELLYTGVTRSRGRVTLIASETALRSAIEHRIERASGLRARFKQD